MVHEIPTPPELPEAEPVDPELLEISQGDTILYGLHISQLQNEVTRDWAENGGLDEDTYTGVMKNYELARGGLDAAIKKRQSELDDRT